METIIDGLKINYIVLGQGRPILILHGWGSKSEKWQEAGGRVSDNGYKVIIPDLPGFGQSQEPPNPWGLNEYCDFLEKFIAKLVLAKFYLLGHSFGGAIAVKYAIKNPQKVEKLFLAAPALLRKKTVRKKVFRITAKIFKHFSFLPFYNLLRKGFYKFIVKKSDYAYLSGVVEGSYLKVIAEDLSNELVFIKTKTIIIWGKKDDATPFKDAYLIKEKIKNSKLEIIEKGTHDLEIKTPEILSNKILENLN